MLRTLIVSLFTLFQITNSQLVGNQHDDHECVLDGGYQWCATLNQCVRPWTTPCPPNRRHPVDPLPYPIRRMEGESCGGFTAQMNRCAANLECVSTMGPYIADAPGKCLPKCPTLRDDWGNCIPKDCLTWFDGCNECQIKGNQKSCTETQCLQPMKTVCKQKETLTIPKDCVSWFDGCNRCMVSDGRVGGCTRMYCFNNQDTPHCMSYTKGKHPLKVGEVCSRFCEDNSELSVTKAHLCPKGTLCQSTTQSMVSFDTCGSRAYRCVISNH